MAPTTAAAPVRVIAAFGVAVTATKEET